MKALKLFTLLGFVSALSVSCSSGFKMAGSSSGDDIYYNPSQQQRGQLASASDGRHVVPDKSYQDLLNETNRAMSDTIYVESDSTGNPYQDVLADSYEKAKRNRELGARDPWNNMPTYYSNNNSFWYASAYDPAFYNVIVMGNTVWAEPKYVSSMFGYPYYSPYVNFGSYYSPWRNWNLSFNFGWNQSWAWGYDPFYDPYWGWGGGWSYPGYGYPYYGWGYPYYYGGGHYYSHDRYFPSQGSQGRYSNYGFNDNSRYSRASSRSYSPSRGTISSRDGSFRRGDVRDGNSSVRPSMVSSGNGTMRRETSRNVQNSSVGTAGTPARRPSSISQSRPVTTVSGDSYTPSYTRPARTEQSVFNEGGRGGNQSYQRRPTSVATPRTERPAVQSDYGRTRDTYTPSRSSYTPSYSNSNSNSSSYSSPSRSSGSSSSGRSETRGGGRR